MILSVFSRYMRKWLAAPMLLILPFASAAEALADKEPLRLKPTSKWTVDYSEERCTLVRQFGEGDETSLVYFRRYSPDEAFKLTIAGKPFERGKDYYSANIQFGPNEQIQEREYLPGTLPSDKPLPSLVFSGPIRLEGPRLAADARKSASPGAQTESPAAQQPIDEARRAAITYLMVSKPLRRPVILETGPMAKPMAALSQCVDELLTHWGIDLEKHKSLRQTVEPVGSPGNWLRSEDYPIEMLSEGQPGLIDFRLNIDEKGGVTSCHIQSTTRPKEFDNAVCKVLVRRAKFTPALDANGQPLASYWQNRVRFQIPR